MIIPSLEPAFSVRIDFPLGPRLRMQLRGDEARGFVPITSGSISGPLLTGEVVAGSGGDWPLFRSDGVVAFDARYLLRAADDTLIHVVNRGYAHAPSDVQAKIDRGVSVDPADHYFRLAPTFEAPPGPHEWLARSIFVGVGEKHRDHSVFHYCVVR